MLEETGDFRPAYIIERPNNDETLGDPDRFTVCKLISAKLRDRLSWSSGSTVSSGQATPTEPNHAADNELEHLEYPTILHGSPSRSVSTPITAMTTAVQRPLAIDTELAKKEAARSSSLSCATSPTWDYPPDSKSYIHLVRAIVLTMIAPDRPAPLSLRSPSSLSSGFTLRTTGSSSLASTPALRVGTLKRIPSPPPRNSVLFQTTASHPLLNPLGHSPLRVGKETYPDDVFGAYDQSPNKQYETSTDNAAQHDEDHARSEDCRPYGSYKPEDEYKPYIYELTESDRGSFGDDEDTVADQDSTSTRTYATEQRWSNSLESFEELLSYAGSSDETNVETASVLSAEEIDNTQSTRSSLSHHGNVVTREPQVLASPHSEVKEPSNDTDTPYHSSITTAFHRPLPFRCYEPAPTRSAQPTQNISTQASPPPASTAPSPTTLDPLTLATALLLFPLPPSSSPLSSLLHALTHATLLHHLPCSPATAATYRDLSATYIITLVQRTRNYAARLPKVKWKEVDEEERMWRVENRKVLMAVLGRVDGEMGKGEAEVVRGIVEILGGDGEVEGEMWVRDVVVEEDGV